LICFLSPPSAFAEPVSVAIADDVVFAVVPALLVLLIEAFVDVAVLAEPLDLALADADPAAPPESQPTMRPMQSAKTPTEMFDKRSIPSPC